MRQIAKSVFPIRSTTPTYKETHNIKRLILSRDVVVSGRYEPFSLYGESLVRKLQKRH